MAVLTLRIWVAWRSHKSCEIHGIPFWSSLIRMSRFKINRANACFRILAWGLCIVKAKRLHAYNVIRARIIGPH